MAKKRYHEHAQKREPGGYVPLPHVVLRSAQFATLSARATKLLLDLLAQYRGDNNGDLCGAATLMQARGWRSNAGLAQALRELEHRRFIICTRQGGRHRASLYGVTFYSIDWCGGKLEINAPSRKFLGTWQAPKVVRHGDSSAPQVGQFSNDCPKGGAIQASAMLNCPSGGAVRPLSAK